MSRHRSAGNHSDRWGELIAAVDAAASARDDDASVPGVKFDRFELLQRLGEGGMGVVFRARDTKLKRDVALKVLTLPSEQVEAAVLHEARCLAQLSHPNVVALYDTGKIGTEMFLTMEFVQGIDGRKVISKFKPTWQQSLKLFVGAGRGLAAAHAAGLEHGDFKPENLLISFDQRVLVADFGVAHLLWNLCTDTTTSVGYDVRPLRVHQACGDGNSGDTDDDSSTCQAATYGDGFVWVDDEVCDDSNDEDTDDCLVDTCEPTTCSGAAAEGEGNDECDDSDVNATNDCVRVCMLPARGDGFLRTDNAPCDRNALSGPGSLEYMAPERLLGGRGDARSDQFSFCVALWEFIYGVRPFDGAKGEELFSAIVNGKLTRSELNEKVPGRVLKVIAKGLSWHARDRWPDMKSLVRALEAVRSSDQRPRPRRLRAVMAVLGLVVTTSLVTAAMILAPDDRATETAGFADLGDSLISLAGADVVDVRATWAAQIAIVAARAGNVDAALRSLESAKRAELSEETSRGLALASEAVAAKFERQVRYKDAMVAWSLAMLFARDAGDLEIEERALEHARLIDWLLYPNNSASKQVTVPSSLQTPSWHQ